MIYVTDGMHIKGVVDSPHHGQRIHRAGSIDTLSPCESIASDDLMLDYSDTSSYEEQQRLVSIDKIIYLENDRKRRIKDTVFSPNQIYTLLLSFRLNPNVALHELDDATIISELEAQGEEVMRQWSSLLSTAHMKEQVNSNTANNNVHSEASNNNNQSTAESGCVLVFFTTFYAYAYVA